MSDTSPDITKLNLLVQKLYDENDGTRNAAALHVYRWMTKNGVHPADMVLDVRGESHKRTERVRKRLEEENQELRQKLVFYETNADPKKKRLAEKAGSIVNRWAEFEALAHSRVGNKRGWQTSVQSMVGVSPSQFTRWQRGLVEIPAETFSLLRTADIPVRVRAPRKKKVRHPDPVELAAAASP